jgi:hypothetical protein
MEAYLQTTLFRQWPDNLDALLCQLAHVNKFHLDAVRSGIEAGQGQEPFDQTVELQTDLATTLQGGAIFLRRP